MARAASEAKATASDTSDVEAVLSAEEETDAYERVLAVCENSIADYTRFLEVRLMSSKVSARTSRTDLQRNWLGFLIVLCYVNLLQASEESDDEATNADSSARLSRSRMLQQLAVALCKNEQRILFRLQYVSTLFFPSAKIIPSFDLQYSIWW